MTSEALTNTIAPPVGREVLLTDTYFEGLLRTEPVQVMGFGMCPDTNERRMEIQEMVARGNLPPIGYFTIALDTHPTTIPPNPYTRYFSQWRAPVADIGLEEHEHDSEHVIGFEHQFRSLLFSSVVARAANKALDDWSDETFTHAMDGFGDRSLDILEGLTSRRTYEAARSNLFQLVTLCAFESDQLAEQVCQRLCFELGLAPDQERLDSGF